MVGRDMEQGDRCLGRGREKQNGNRGRQKGQDLEVGQRAAGEEEGGEEKNAVVHRGAEGASKSSASTTGRVLSKPSQSCPQLI